MVNIFAEVDMSFLEVERIVDNLTQNKIIPAISMAVGIDGEIVFQKQAGHIYESYENVEKDCQFDIASMTKIFTCICFMKMVEEGLFSLNQPISELFPRMGGNKPIEKDGQIIGYADGSSITWWNVLTHTTGIGWTRPKTRPSLLGLEESLDAIFSLPFAANVNEHVIYSDVPIILMGKAMELKEKKTLEQIVNERLLCPLRLKGTEYRRKSKYVSFSDAKKNKIPPTEYDEIFRKKRIWGEVHDENAWCMDGVAAHAGLFATASDVCYLMMKYAEARVKGGILSLDIAKEMSSLQVEEDGDRRGLMWQLSGNGEEAYTRFLSRDSYGHAGFTGCFAWNDPSKNISIVFLSNDIYNGRDNRVLTKYRSQIMEQLLT